MNPSIVNGNSNAFAMSGWANGGNWVVNDTNKEWRLATEPVFDREIPMLWAISGTTIELYRGTNSDDKLLHKYIIKGCPTEVEVRVLDAKIGLRHRCNEHVLAMAHGSNAWIEFETANPDARPITDAIVQMAGQTIEDLRAAWKLEWDKWMQDACDPESGMFRIYTNPVTTIPLSGLSPCSLIGLNTV